MIRETLGYAVNATTKMTISLLPAESVTYRSMPKLTRLRTTRMQKKLNLRNKSAEKRLKHLILVFCRNQCHKSQKRSLNSHTLHSEIMSRPESLSLQILVFLLRTKFSQTNKTYNIIKIKESIKT